MSLDLARLSRVADELEIRNLLARMSNTVDAFRRGDDVDDLADWTEDCVWESATFGRYEGHAGLRELKARTFNRQDPARTDLSAHDDDEDLHMVLNTEVLIDGDAAVCHSKWLFGLRRGAFGDILRMGRYEDHLVRGQRGWKLRHRIVDAR